jgi:hypothetical protein
VREAVMSVSKNLGLILLLAGCGTIDRTRIDPSKILEEEWQTDECPVHHKMLVVSVEPMFVGYTSWGPGRQEYLDTEKRLFPYAVVDKESQSDFGKTHWRAHYCPDCRKAEQGWQEEHAFRPDEREILRRYIEGKSVERAGEEMGLKPDIARVRFASAVVRLNWLIERAAKQDAAR